MKLSHILCLVAACFCMPVLTACQGPQAPTQVAQNLSSIRAEMMNGRESIVWVGKSLTSLRSSNGADLKLQFENYTRNLETMEAKAGGVKLVLDMQQDRTEQYFQKWEKEIDALASEDLRRRGGDRRDIVLQAYNDLKARIVTLRKSFQPYHASLRDTHRFLASDLTPAGLKTAKPNIELALQRQEKVLSDLDKVVEGIDQITKN